MKKEKTLAIMAAGLGSRFGGLKQLHYITANNYSIIDFSIYDAIKAGFNTIVFIVREDILKDFKIRYEKQLNPDITIKFVIQDIKSIPNPYKAKCKRKKPWGTGHALLMLKDVVTNNFALINADDFYGRTAFKMMHDALFASGAANTNFLLGYDLKNTLSNSGSVSRGECIVDNNNCLVSIHERTEIEKQKSGVITYTDIKNTDVVLTPETIVSMNFWGFSPKILEIALHRFNYFLESSETNDNAEFYITTIVDYTIKNKLMPFKMLPTSSQWYGITYKDDINAISANISQLIQQYIYPEKLW